MYAHHVCTYYWRRAMAYVARETQGWTREHLAEVLAMDHIRADDHKINEALLAGDPEALKDACRLWWQDLLGETF